MALSLWAAACGDGGAGPEPPPNQAPLASGTIPAQTVAAGESATVNVAAYFSDPDGGALTYAATSSDAGVASVAVAGSVVTVTAVARGMATITVTARDPGGLTAQASFTVTVPNRAPEAGEAIPEQVVHVGEETGVELSAHFSDPEGDSLAYAAESSDTAVATVVVADGVATVSGVGQGTATVTVTATDGDGLSAEQAFAVTVPNRSPEAGEAIPEQVVHVGEEAGVELSAHFSDPDGDSLSYAAESSDTAVATVVVADGVATVAGAGQGTATVTVTATDGGGLPAEQTFAVTVPNRSPEAGEAVPEQVVHVGEAAEVELSAHFSDPDGDSLSYAAESSDTAVATVVVADGVATVAGAGQGTATVTVTATDGGGLSAEQTFAVTVPNRSPEVTTAIEDASLHVGDTLRWAGADYFSDPDGDSLAFAAESSDAGVAFALVAGGVIGVHAGSPGTATVTVTATDGGGLSAEQIFAVTVPNRSPEVTTAIEDLSLIVGDTLRWAGAGHFFDPDGDSLTYAAESSNAGVAAAAASGGEFTAAAVAPGTATVTVTATDPGGLSAQLDFTVTVRRRQGPAILSVDPGVLVEGASATIRGAGFSDSATRNRVTLGGRSARVTAASANRLTITVPGADCLPPRREELRVAVGTTSDTRTVGVTPMSAEDMELERGWYRYTNSGYGCVHLPADAAGGEYLVGVVSTSQDAASLTSIRLTGTPGEAAVAGVENGRIVVAAEPGTGDETSGEGNGRFRVSTHRDGSAMAALARGPFRSQGAFDRESSGAFDRAPASSLAAAPMGGIGVGERPLADDTVRIRRVRAHGEIMARNEALLNRLGRATRPALASARRNPQVGDTLTLYADRGASCGSARQVRAVVRFVGNSSIWLDDLGNPSDTFTDAELAGLDAFYSSNIEGVHDGYFGGLSDVDGNGRFLVLMTKEVNRAGNIEGWVWPADLYPSSVCATSNQAEVFYGMVPDPDGIAGDAVTKQHVLDVYPPLIAHEVTHLVQADAHIFGNAAQSGLKASWEWEGGATLAEQLVAYRVFGHGSGRELGWAAYNHSAESRDWYGTWLGDMALFFGWDYRGDGDGRISRAPEECSWIGRPDEGNSGPCLLGGREVYGVPSMVYRYAMDRWGGDYPGGERALMRRLTQSPVQGFASLVDVSPEDAWPPEQILADFYMTLWMDIQGWETSGMATWDLHDIFMTIRENTRLQPRTSSSPEPRLNGRVRAGSNLYLHWIPRGSLNPTAIRVTLANGGRLASHMSVWALRVR